MYNNIKKLADETLTRIKIDAAVENFAENHCGKGVVYDIGGVAGYNYKKYFSDYKIVNFNRKERPDILADVEKLPFKSGTVRNIICIALLEHVKNPEAAVKEIYKVMKRHARALIWVPFYWREHNYPIDNYRFTLQGITALLKRHGLKIITSDFEPYSGFFFILSHNVRFFIKNPHRTRIYNPLLYFHALLCYLSRLDKIFNLKYPNLYTGVEIIVEK